MTIAELYTKFLECKSQVCTDTRKLSPGCMFIALRGDNFDGNQFALEALSAGAKYALIDDLSLKDTHSNLIYVENVLETFQQLAHHHRTVLKTPIIAITGSNGKTTTKELAHAVLSQKYKTACTQGNLNNHIGIPITLLSIQPTHDIAIVEMGANHQGEIAAYCEYVAPNFGIITNFGKAHLEGFGGVEGVIKGKSELYQYIAKHRGKVFVNADDPISIQKVKAYDLEAIAYSSTDSDHYVYGVATDISSTLTVEVDRKVKIYSQLTGVYNLSNILCAYTIGKFFEIDDMAIKKAIETYSPQNSRSQLKKIGSNLWILDAYNANPSSMEVAIVNLSHYPNNKVAILGEMNELGEHTEQEHQKVVELATELSINTIILIGVKFKKSSQNKPVKWFETVSEAKVWLENQNFNDSTILLKGSRSVALEKIL